ncbi:ABC-2 family transporter protein [Candidatus Gottesmanbacteria bacterium]|nr:ABC-2 family transporter protein [Candidatus Gottesmanbacteria bacterium]
MKTLKKYYRIWSFFTVNSVAISLFSRFGAIVFVIGKLIRFLFFLLFLLIIMSKTNSIAGFNLKQTILFYLTFNIIDTVSQLFLREVYRFRPLVISGNFDLVLVKPMNPLFRILAGGADPFDLIILIILLIFTFISIQQIPNMQLINILFYIILCLNGFFISTAFHIMVAALAILTSEIDHTIMIYRDLTNLGRVPVDIYQQPLRFFITFILPIGVMMTFPAKALMGFLSWQGLAISFLLAIIFLGFGFSLWRYSLSKYSSASS